MRRECGGWRVLAASDIGRSVGGSRAMVSPLRPTRRGTGTPSGHSEGLRNWRTDEAPVSTQRQEAIQEAWVPAPDEQSRRSCGVAVPPPDGPRPPLGMTGRLTGQGRFAELQAVGVRSGRGPLRRVFRADPTQGPAIAFAIPRSVGPAVIRNRIKRRLRAVIADLERQGGLAGGDHLIRVTSSLQGWSHARLRAAVAELLEAPIPPPSTPTPGGVAR